MKPLKQVAASWLVVLSVIELVRSLENWPHYWSHAGLYLVVAYLLWESASTKGTK